MDVLTEWGVPVLDFEGDRDLARSRKSIRSRRLRA